MMPAQKPATSRQDYGTPPEFLQAVRDRLMIESFSVDLAADEINAVCHCFIHETEDSLKQEWTTWGNGWFWLNPPFSNIKEWVAKAADEANKGAQIAMLVPSAVGSNWWRDYVATKAYICHLNGRLTFVGETAPYPKDCSLLLYHPFGFLGTETWNWRASL
jgi:phage N-6-adenine-methyltransferase